MLRATERQLKVRVPTGATNCPITVITPFGTNPTTKAFVGGVGGVVTVRVRSVANPDPLTEGKARITGVSPRGPIYSPAISAQPGVPDVLGPVHSPDISAGPSE